MTKDELFKKKMALETWFSENSNEHPFWGDNKITYAEVCNKLKKPEAIKGSRFGSSKLVVCGFCMAKDPECRYCGGEGVLHRVIEGTVSLYRVN